MKVMGLILEPTLYYHSVSISAHGCECTHTSPHPMFLIQFYRFLVKAISSVCVINN